MASKEFKAAYSGGAGVIDLVCQISTIKTDIAKNQTTERTNLYMDVKNASYQYFNNYGTEAFVGVNGNNTTKTVNFDARTTGTKILISSWDTVVEHDANGKKSINISAHHYSGVGLGNAEIVGTYDCDTIPRYATSVQSLKSKTETSIIMNWSSDSTVDNVWYSTNNGSSWTNAGSVNAKSGSYTISGLKVNTSYQIKTRVRRKDSQLTTDSSALSVTTYNYPYVTAISTSNLVIGNSQKITLYNPLKRDITVYMRQNNESGTELYSCTTTGTELTFTPDPNTLYKSISSAQSSNCVYYCIFSAHLVSTKNGTYKIKGDEKPTFTIFNVEDINSTSVAITGDKTTFINTLSNAKVSIFTTNKAIAKNGASISKYRVVIGNSTKEIAYSGTAEVSTTINAVTSSIITVSAIDSRGLETTVTKTVSIKNYSKPTFNIFEVLRENGVGTTGLLNLKVNFWNNNFRSS